MTSVLNVDTISAKDGTSPVALTKQHASKFWVYYNTSTFAVNGSFNQSSSTDNGTGDTTFTYTNSLNDANDVSATGMSNAYHCINMVSPTTTAIRFGTYNSSHALTDTGRIFGLVHGDLA